MNVLMLKIVNQFHLLSRGGTSPIVAVVVYIESSSRQRKQGQLVATLGEPYPSVMLNQNEAFASKYQP
jgi:hypothetical protein